MSKEQMLIQMKRLIPEGAVNPNTGTIITGITQVINDQIHNHNILYVSYTNRFTDPAVPDIRDKMTVPAYDTFGTLLQCYDNTVLIGVSSNPDMREQMILDNIDEFRIGFAGMYVPNSNIIDRTFYAYLHKIDKIFYAYLHKIDKKVFYE